VNDFQEKLSSSWIENENGSIDGFGGQVTLKGFVDGNTIDVGVINKPNNLIAKEFSIILRVEIRLSRLR